MGTAILMLWLLGPPSQAATLEPREQRLAELIQQVAQSGRVLEIGEERHKLDDPRMKIAPGAPPLLAFRYFYGADRHRFGKMDLMLDDAGH
jgi:hypothetical protein